VTRNLSGVFVRFRAAASGFIQAGALNGQGLSNAFVSSC
jgi:hypothetical protein